MSHFRPLDRYRRRIAAAVLAAVYFCILLAPVVSGHPQGENTVVRHCSGDCDLCGCSIEARVTGSCCCAKQRQLEADRDLDQDLDETPECCKKKKSKQTVISCACPMGAGQRLSLSAAGLDLLPFIFTSGLSRARSGAHFTEAPHRLTSRYLAPPDPPPDLV